MADDITYTQEVDEKTGEIKYVPNRPPQSPDLLKRLEDNNKRLRYNKRLENGKLDGRRLTAYKTSNKLFKKKAIKYKNYQFTIMLDTSGSMLNDQNGSRATPQDSKYAIGISTLAQVTQSLESLNIPISLIAMNEEIRMVKDFDEKYNQSVLFERLRINFVDEVDDRNNIGGTSEGTGYLETLKHIVDNSTAKTENIVIVLSDGEPNTDWHSTMVAMSKTGETVEIEDGTLTDNVRELKEFWNKQNIATPYGIGLMSDASQLPRSQRLNHIDKLPELMSNLIQEILL